MLLPSTLESRTLVGNPGLRLEEVRVRWQKPQRRSVGLASVRLPTTPCPRRQATYCFQVSFCPPVEWGENVFLIPASSYQGAHEWETLIGHSWDRA